jgi:choline dehydrogenase-like flavoprotein
VIRDLNHELPLEEEMADVCVVGAGAAGIVLAVELARQGKRVVVLEGGGEHIEEASQDPYVSEVVGQMHRGIHAGRFRAHGGTTRKWGGQILAYDDIDFAQREWVPGSGWPFGKQELMPFYERALVLEGVNGALQSNDAVWRALGEGTPEFEDLLPFFTRWCPDPNFAKVHRKTLEADPHVEVWLHANAVGMDMDGEHVRQVQVRTLEGRTAAFRARQFVFCMGAIESSRFFLQPREGGLPWNLPGLLGKHFQDHADCNGATVKPKSQTRFHELFDNVFLHGYKYHPKLKLKPEVQQKESVLHAGATMFFQSDADEALMSLKQTAKAVLRGQIGEVTGAELARMLKNLPLLSRQMWRYTVRHRAYNPGSSSIQLRVHCEQEPLSQSSISLATERDKLGLLRTRLDWRISDWELETIRVFVRHAAQSLAELAEVIPHPALLEGGDSLRARCDDSNHHMGGMRMNAAASRGVVTPELRLHGTSNCFVCSAAVFPTSGFSNPTHTVLALAVRLSDSLVRILA